MKKAHYWSKISQKTGRILIAPGIVFIISLIFARSGAQGAFQEWIWLGPAPDTIETFETAIFDDPFFHLLSLLKTNNFIGRLVPFATASQAAITVGKKSTTHPKSDLIASSL